MIPQTLPAGAPIWSRTTPCWTHRQAVRAFAPEHEILIAPPLGQDPEARLLLAAMERRLHESDHRIKNHLQLVASTLSMQARDSLDAGLADQLRSAAGRIMAVARVHARLQETGAGMVDAGLLVRELCADLAGALGMDARGVVLAAACDPILLDGGDAAALCQIVNELVTNSLKHAYPAGGGAIEVSLRREGEARLLSVADHGPGLPDGGAPSEGLGLKLVGLCAARLGAAVFVDRSAGGAVVGVRF